MYNTKTNTSPPFLHFNGYAKRPKYLPAEIEILRVYRLLLERRGMAMKVIRGRERAARRGRNGLSPGYVSLVSYT